MVWAFVIACHVVAWSVAAATWLTVRAARRDHERGHAGHGHGR